MMQFLLLIIFLISPLMSAADSLKIQVLEKGTQVPLKELSVFILPDKLKVTTDYQGRSEIADFTLAEGQIVISTTGFLRYEKTFNFSEQRNIIIYLEKESYSAFETIIVDTKLKRDQSQKTLTRKEFLEMPGANGDPLRAVQNLPGINRTGGYSSQVVIQGSAPKDTAYDFEGHHIPIVFHFGGLSSVVMPEALEQVDYLSAGYGAEYSRALGGIISLKSRKPDVKERSKKGLFYVDNLSAGGLYEAEIDSQSSFLISGRYSYIGTFLKAATKNSDVLNLTVAPEFQDITAIYNREISDAENFKLSLLGSRDRLAFVLAEPYKQDPSVRGAFSNTVNFYRLIPAWTKKVNAFSTYRLSAGIGKDELAVEVGDQYFKLASQVLTTRGEWEYQATPAWQSQLGFDNQYAHTNVNLRLPIARSSGGVGNPISTAEKREAIINQKTTNLGFYWRNQIALDERWDVLPSLRVDRFSVTKETFLLPRLAFRYKYSDSLQLKTAAGLYVQPPEPQEANADFGNPDIKSPHARHFTLGFEKDFREGSKEGSLLSASYFERTFDQLVIQSSATTVRDGSTVPELFNNDGKGRAYGIETQWKFIQSNFNGFVSYTWSKSTRWQPGQSEYNFEYDQTHNFNLVLAKNLPREWKISSRLRYVTGNPKTPVIGATYDADNEVYFPQRGPIYSTRLKDFYQLDLRIDKKFVSDRAIWSVYLDIQNILNTKNPESIQYAYDYSTSEQITGLPILPAIGVKGEF
ncbi:MAG: TonB-dependent receptor [Bdellovibrionaceae bacterium]|nr:TonB-dependent receptor [Bdellovibrio sp.]